MPEAPLTFVTYENRLSDIIGLKLLILSIVQPGGVASRMIVYCPKEFGDFRPWTGAIPNVELRDCDDVPVKGWEVKPTLLLKLLDEGVTQPIWIDSDIMLSAPARAPWFAIAPGQILTSSDYSSNSPVYQDRAKLAGMITARRLKFSVNSCVLRVDSSHRELLKAWENRMTWDDFQFGQRNRNLRRSAHLASDQDVLWSLLCSRDFGYIPVRQLQSGVDIAQSWSLFEFPLHFRLRAMFTGLPPFVHAAGIRPWRIEGSRIPFTVAQLQPYNKVVRQYVKQLPSVADWTYPTSKLSIILRLWCLGSTTLSVIPLQIAVFLNRLRRQGVWWLDG
jgi:hypothetical protein